jgi:hypothetical protein
MSISFMADERTRKGTQKNISALSKHQAHLIPYVGLEGKWGRHPWMVGRVIGKNC